MGMLPRPPGNRRWPSWTHEIVAALVFLTRLPMPQPAAPADDLNVRAMGWFPVIGAGVGAIGGLVYALGEMARLTPIVAAPLAVAAMVWLTGGLHEDGLADMADGLGGGGDRAAKLAVMADSRLGTYGAAALILGLLLRSAVVASLAPASLAIAGLAAAGAVSRAGLPALAACLPPARPGGLAARFGQPLLGRAAMAAGLSLAIAVALLGSGAIVPVLTAAAATAVVGWLAHRHIGGYTGDVLGAAQQAAEIGFLIALTAVR